MKENINLESLFSNKGSNKEDWNYIEEKIKNEEYSEKIIENLSHYLQKKDQDEVTLALDITDYILDFGCPKIISLVAQQNFLEDILNLIRSETNANIINQKLVIYLIQKWAKKFLINKELNSFQKNFTILQNYGIEFPDENFSMDTYHKYINEEQLQNKNLNQNPQPQNVPHENNKINNNENQQPNPLIQNSENNNQPSQFQGPNNINNYGQNINQGYQNDFKPEPYKENNNNNNNNILRSRVNRNEINIKNQNINKNNINNQNPDFKKPVSNINNNNNNNPWVYQNNINNSNHNTNGYNFNQNNMYNLNNNNNNNFNGNNYNQRQSTNDSNSFNREKNNMNQIQQNNNNFNNNNINQNNNNINNNFNNNNFNNNNNNGFQMGNNNGFSMDNNNNNNSKWEIILEIIIISVKVFQGTINSKTILII